MFLPFRENALFVAKATRESSFCGKGFPEKRSLRAHAEKDGGNGKLPISLKTGELSNKACTIASRFLQKTARQTHAKQVFPFGLVPLA